MAEIEKHNNDWMIEQTDKAISELVYDKAQLIKAYNYYSGIRDLKQFQHLEKNYGLGTPTSISFTPIVRPHIDVLVGEFLTMPLKPSTSCKDETTINNIAREKLLAITQKLFDIIKQKMQQSIYSILRGDGQHKVNDIQFAQELKNAEDLIDLNFVSSFEQASSNIIKWMMQSRDIDIQAKLGQLATDYLISGEAYFRSLPTMGGEQIELRVINPINFFPDMNVNSPYVNDAYRAVYREYLTKTEIMMRYGSQMSQKDIDALESNKSDFASNHVMLTYNNQRLYALDLDFSNLGLLDGYGFTPEYNYTPQKKVDLYCVYDVEWIDYEFNEKKERIEHRYHAVRIGGEIYILYDKDLNVTRSQASPNECKLSFNGIQNVNRTGGPFSMVLATADLQDHYDIANFYKDTIVANSGINGDWIDINMIPSFLGLNAEEKITKFIGYKKNGVALIDTTTEGAQPMNTTFGGYDDTLKLQAIQAINLVIDDIQNQLARITGVTEQRLGNIAQRDAVANVEAGMQLSFIITKKYFQAMNQIFREMLLDSLNLAKIVYKNGISGTLILGDYKKEIFTALPESFTVSDFDIHIINSEDAIKEKQQIQLLSLELVKGGLIDPSILLAVTTSDNMSQMRHQVNKSLLEKKEENDMLNKMNEQLQQLQEQNKQLQQQNKQLQGQISKFDQMQYQLDAQKLRMESQFKQQELDFKREVEDKKLNIEKTKAQIEYAQLYDDNPNNDRIRYNYNE